MIQIKSIKLYDANETMQWVEIDWEKVQGNTEIVLLLFSFKPYIDVVFH